MKKKLILLSILFLPSILLANDLVKVGVYNFNDVIDSMSKKPSLRALIPEVLKENAFLIKMIQGENRLHNKIQVKSALSVEDKINYYAKKNYLKNLLKKSFEENSSARRSNKMKQYLFSALYTAQNYFGYNLILKPSPKILYRNKTILNPSIAEALTVYITEKNKKAAKEMAIEEVSENQ